MPKFVSALSPGEQDPVLIERVARVRRICLWLVAVAALLNLAAWLVPGMACDARLRWHMMKPDSAGLALCLALSLRLAERQSTRWTNSFALALGIAAGLYAGALLLAPWLGFSPGINASLASGCAPLARDMSLQTAGAFSLLALAFLFSFLRGRTALYVGDTLVFALCLLVLILVSGYVFGAVRLFGNPSEAPTSPQTLMSVALLTVATLLRRTEAGVFSVFSSRGIGSRVARVLAPILIVMPFVREAWRIHMTQTRLFPPAYATAILASMASMLALLLLVFLAWYINSMEAEIRDLSLRDELTGLYNSRGFWLLADHALRVAQRSQLPFSVLFIDFDNLKQVNDSMGHAAGSAYLAELGQVLKSTFREVDVAARVGGDEFAVAGHFSSVATSIAIQRLRSAAQARNAEANRRFPLSFSIGYVTAAEQKHETLKELLEAADRAMYEDKRRRKSGEE